MKKVLLFTLLLVSYTLHSQDTTIIQTLTFDSAGRNYVFDFPQDNGQSYEKIIMEYRIRCKDGLVSSGTNTNLGCGEWDYSCNTYITDSSYTDSLKSIQANYIISDFNETSFNYTTYPTFSYFQSTQQELVYTDTTSETVAIIGSGVNSSSFPFDNTTGQAKVQYLITADELSDDGMIAGDLTGLRMSLDALGDDLNNLRIKIKETSAIQLDTLNPELDGFYTVYYLNTSFQSIGSHQFNFNNVFDWNGTSNIIVQFSFDQSLGNSTNVLSDSIANYGIATKENDYSLSFNGVESVEIEYSFPTIQNEITISFWAYGNADLIPINTTILEGIDNNNLRQVNVHLPWGNSNVYWDCGNDGSGYDRIYKAAIENEIEGQWNYWVFTKNAIDGTMKIYLNGALWHSATGKTKAIDVQSFHIGSSVNMLRGYYGKIDEFRIWDIELSASEIAEYMYSSIPYDHPNIDNLLAYYNFNVGQGTSLNDQTGNHPGTLLNYPLWRAKTGDELFMEFAPLSERPNMEVLQGEYTSTSTDYILLDSLINHSNRIQEYSVIGTDLNLDSTYYYYQSGDMPVYDEAGNIIDYVTISAEGSIDIVDLVYYKKFPSRFEIMSFVTPYGINLDLGMEGKMWQFDVTDFAPILKDSKQLSVEFGKYQEEMDIRFLYISGTAPRDVLNIQQVWRAGIQEPYAKISNNTVFEPRNLQLDPMASTFKVRAAITGHGQQGEFIPRTHYIDIDGGSNEMSWQVWKECADNPIFPQGGTWIYDRAGWCPGAATDMEEYELSNNSGDTIEIDYGIVYATGTSNYLVSVQLVSYEEANFTLDAGIVEVKRPSNRIEYDRINPICYEPIVVIQNTGSTILTDLTISYEVEGGVAEEYLWSGSLDFMEKEDVVLPISDQSFWAGNGNEVFTVNSSNPNSGSDEYENNNSYSSPFTLSDIHNSLFYIKLRTNNDSHQNSYTVKDMDGNIVYSKSGLDDNTTYRDTLDLPPGCYTFELEDTGNDGLYFWANSAQGTGYVKLVDVESGSTVVNFQRDFGKSIEYAFSYGTAVNISEVEAVPLFSVYPNPTKNQFFVDLELTETSDIQVIIHDIAGREIERQELSNIRDVTLTFDLSNESNGIYYCTVISSNSKVTKMVALGK